MDMKKWNPYDIPPEEAKMQFTGKEFRKKYGAYVHEFTKIDYIDFYEAVNDNIKVIVSRDPAAILKHTDKVIAADIHGRDLTKAYLLKCGAAKVLTMSELLSEPSEGRGHNEKYGLLGSNMFGDSEVKLFPRNCNDFVRSVQDEFCKRTRVRPHVMIYADGAFKDPVCGIWELADPVVSPGYTEGLNGSPNEVKLKMIVAREKDKEAALRKAVENADHSMLSLGTTPRQYTDLLGSISDLVGGSGDKGTPVMLIRGYFDNLLKE
jgi:hypothetical protein